MKGSSLFRVVLSGLIGLVIGFIFTGLVKLFEPSANLTWTLLPICLAAVLSGLVGYVVGARQKK